MDAAAHPLLLSAAKRGSPRLLPTRMQPTAVHKPYMLQYILITLVSSQALLSHGKHQSCGSSARVLRCCRAWLDHWHSANSSATIIRINMIRLPEG